MAAIVIIHGINNEQFGPHTRRAEWLPPLRDGLAFAKGPDYPLPSDADVVVAFWGDLFRPKAASMSGTIPPLEAEDLSAPDEQALLAALLQHAESIGAVSRSADGSMGSSHAWVQAALWKLAATDFFRALYGSAPDYMLIWLLKQVHEYMHNIAGKFDLVQARVANTIRDDTRVVIGHSLGSVVAYEALCSDARNVETLITLGSPLGIPTVIYDRLRPLDGWVQRGALRVRRRPKVKTWYNFAEQRDLIALVKALNPLFEPSIIDAPLDVGAAHSSDISDLHSIVKHLTNAAVGEAIASAWSGSPISSAE